jgi:hypothetical protein
MGPEQISGIAMSADVDVTERANLEHRKTFGATESGFVCQVNFFDEI